MWTSRSPRHDAVGQWRGRGGRQGNRTRVPRRPAGKRRGGRRTGGMPSREHRIRRTEHGRMQSAAGRDDRPPALHPGAAECPGASEIGELEVHSPCSNTTSSARLPRLTGHQPFASPLVVYFLAEDPVSGVRLKLAGETRLEPNGQLIGVFKNTPPAAGRNDRSAPDGRGTRPTFATPPYCRPYTSIARFTTWSGQHTERTSTVRSRPKGRTGPPASRRGKLPFAPRSRPAASTTAPAPTAASRSRSSGPTASSRSPA